MVKYTHLIPLFPLGAFLINILFGRRIGIVSALVSIGAAAVSLAFSIFTFLSCLNGNIISYTFIKWLNFNNGSLDFGVRADALSCIMLLVVSVVGILVQIYSTSYMHGDKRFGRYFAYISLFMASMLALVLADNFVMFYICWEGVGLCSYLLISFWFERVAAAQAGVKAFITTRIGDTGLFIGILILFSLTGSFNFNVLEHSASGQPLLGIAALLIFCGAIGKSAQFPLHVWLPDAMEGPTPVSALIHAATMVAAGVYLVARLFWLFSGNEQALMLVACIGALTAFFAATIAAVQNDIKRILAYSTISQLGLMMAGLGAGGYSAGNFHLMTHAFAKALLFLCAGSVIHAVSTQDVRRMGGLFSKLKITAVSSIIAALSLSGIPPFSGFWSKDDLILEILHSGHWILFSTCVITSLLTAFYMFRMVFLVFFGQEKLKCRLQREPLNAMTIPLIILAVFAVFIGFVGSPLANYAFQNFISLDGVYLPAGAGSDIFIILFLICLSFLGIWLAYSFYVLNNKILSAPILAGFAPLYKLIYNKYYVDEIYDFVFIRPCSRIAAAALKFDTRYVIEGAVNASVKTVSFLSRFTRAAQTGFISNYLFAALAGLLILVIVKFSGIKTCIFRF